MIELLLYNGIIHTEWTADFNVLCYRLLGTWAELIKSQSHTCVNSYCSIKIAPLFPT